MRYTVVIMSKESYEYSSTSSSTYNFNPEYNKLTTVTGRSKSWMVDLVKQKDGVYLVKHQESVLSIGQPPDEYLFLLLPESHPLFNAARVQYLDIADVYSKRISAFMTKVSEGIVRELLNKQKQEV